MQQPRVVIVTGASSGIGAVTARMLAEQGDVVVTVARNDVALKAAAEESTQLHPAPGDVLDADRMTEIVQSAVAAHGRVDAVVHAAQVMAYGRIEDVPVEVFERVVDTAIHGTATVARAVLPVFRRQQHGILVILNSLLGEVVTPQTGAYDVGKWGQRGLAEVLRLETHDDPDIHVCLVSPGAINTPIYDAAANYAGRRGAPPPPVLAPERVARAVLQMLDRPHRQESVGPLNAVVVAGFRLLPWAYERIVGPLVDRVLFRGGSAAPSPGNVFEPGEVEERPHGRWDLAGRPGRD